MTANRRFTLAWHGVIELVLGLVTLISPFLLDFGDRGIVTGGRRGAGGPERQHEVRRDALRLAGARGAAP